MSHRPNPHKKAKQAEEIFEVELILAVREGNGRKKSNEYLIKWVGYDAVCLLRVASPADCHGSAVAVGRVYRRVGACQCSLITSSFKLTELLIPSIPPLTDPDAQFVGARGRIDGIRWLCCGVVLEGQVFGVAASN
jgi:hypothetical protein